jgi:nitrate reductase gamma subunit
MTLKHGESSCERCHYRGNALGASAMVLPAKSILCMPCHAATFSVGDTTTVIALLLFLVGMARLGVVWFSGSLSSVGTATLDGRSGKAVSSLHGTVYLSSMLRLLKVLAFDVFLQRRLFRQSRTRWFIHGLIFFPFVFRFLWGITALLTSLWAPESSLPWVLLDRNYPLGAFLFDASGLLILFGIIFTIVRKIKGQAQAISGLPKQDWPALFLLGSIVVIGFVLEGMRIAMTGAPAGSEYAFLGFALSRLFVNVTALSNVYGYVWYLHAILTGALVAYLPFGNLLHIIIAPVIMALNAMSEADEHQAISSIHPQPMRPIAQ